jgi:hypothetical protein
MLPKGSHKAKTNSNILLERKKEKRMTEVD